MTRTLGGHIRGIGSSTTSKYGGYLLHTHTHTHTYTHSICSTATHLRYHSTPPPSLFSPYLCWVFIISMLPLRSFNWVLSSSRVGGPWGPSSLFGLVSGAEGEGGRRALAMGTGSSEERPPLEDEGGPVGLGGSGVLLSGACGDTPKDKDTPTSSWHSKHPKRLPRQLKSLLNTTPEHHIEQLPNDHAQHCVHRKHFLSCQHLSVIHLYGKDTLGALLFLAQHLAFWRSRRLAFFGRALWAPRVENMSTFRKELHSSM